MRPLSLAPLVALLLAAPAARAQEEPDTAPRPPAPLPADAALPSAQSAGTGRVLQDSIYALALVPGPGRGRADWYARLLDQATARFEADGRGAVTYRQVVQILTPNGAPRWAMPTVSYNADRQRVTFHHARVVRPDGTVVSEVPAAELNVEVAAPEGPDVVTDRMRVRRLLLRGVVPGTVVDYAYTIETIAPALPGDFLDVWRVTPGYAVRRSLFTLDLPAGVTPHIQEQALPAAVVRATRDSAGRRIRTWTGVDVPPVHGAPFSPPAGTYQAYVRVGGPITWTQVGDWFAGLSAPAERVTPAVDAKLREVTAGARTLADSLRAVHRYVTGDVRYVSVALGRGAYTPRTPEAVVESGWGDCKDKVMLFVAAARRFGVEAYPALVFAGPVTTLPADMPTAHAFNHLVAAVRERGAPAGRAGLHFVDLTAAQVAYDDTPAFVRGHLAVIARPGGRSDTLTIPTRADTTTRSALRIVATVDTAGLAKGRVEERAAGDAAALLRARYWQTGDLMARAGQGSMFVMRVAPGAKADSFDLVGVRDLSQPPRATAAFHDAPLVRRSGPVAVLAVPYGPASAGRLRAALQALGRDSTPRTTPIATAGFLPAGVSESQLTATLPDGWTVELPAAVDAVAPFGRYQATFTQRGRELRVTRRLVGLPATLPPAQLPEVKRFLAAAAADDVTLLVVRTRPPTPAPAPSAAGRD